VSVEITRPQWIRERLQSHLSHYLSSLEANNADSIEIGHFERPAGGQSNETILFDAKWSVGSVTHEIGLVVRLQPSSNQIFLDADVLKEGWLLQDLSEHSDVPVPNVIAVEEDPEILGRPFFLMTRVKGHVPGGRPSIHRDPWLAALEPMQRRSVLSNGLRALADVHRVDWRQLRNFASFNAEEGLARELDHLDRWYRWVSQDRKFEFIEAGLSAITVSPPPVDEMVLLWGDARPGNIIFGEDLTVAAVIDWEIATVGPRSQDLGWWLMMQEFADRGAEGYLLDGLPTGEEFVALYLEITDTNPRHLEYFVLLASLRLAITLIPVADSLMIRKILPRESRFAHDNVPTQMVAHQLGITEPELSQDYRRLSRMRDRKTAI
jgi:aminoglycoside phosphotransferase (APT) family kinase protein